MLLLGITIRYDEVAEGPSIVLAFASLPALTIRWLLCELVKSIGKAPPFIIT